MADVLRIKRRSSGGAGAPATLAYAELAYNEVNDVLYYGKGNNAGQAISIIPIAGPGFVSGGSSISVGDTPPASPADNSMWYETDTAILWLRYNDSTSTQWIQISGPPIPASNLFLPLTGGTLTGALYIQPASGSSQFQLRKSGSGFNSEIYGAVNLNIRWGLILGDNTAETGGNAGSNFSIARFNDAGANIDSPLTINRSTGNVVLSKNLSVGNYTPIADMEYDQIYAGHLHMADFAFNAYLVTGTWKRINTGVATIVGMTGGQMAVFSAPSGAAGSTITLAQTFAAQANGNVWQSGAYHYFSGATGTVNAAGGGPFIFADANAMAFHLGQGTSPAAFWFQNKDGAACGGFTSAGWVCGAGNRICIMNDGTNTMIANGSGEVVWYSGNNGYRIIHQRADGHRFYNPDGTAIYFNATTNFCDFYDTGLHRLRITSATIYTGVPSIRSDGQNLILNSVPGGAVYLAWDVTSQPVYVGGPGILYTRAVYGTNHSFAFGWNNYVAGLATISVDNGGAAYGIAAGSDRRMKDNIAPSTFDCLDAVLQMPVRQFHWRRFTDPWSLADAKADDSKFVRVGVIAQEIEQIFPEGVHHGDDFEDHLGRVWNLDQNVMLAVLIGAVQQMQAEITSLKQRLGDV